MPSEARHAHGDTAEAAQAAATAAHEVAIHLVSQMIDDALGQQVPCQTDCHVSPGTCTWFSSAIRVAIRSDEAHKSHRHTRRSVCVPLVSGGTRPMDVNSPF